MPRKRFQEDKEGLRTLYFQNGLQYYTVARYAAFSGFIPVCGSLFHHAIEMYLKGYFCKLLDEKQRRNLGHDLKKMWRNFKKDSSDPTLARFDNAIVALDKHERIRYPEVIAKKGMGAYIHFKKDGLGPTAASARKEPVYEIVVDELDALSRVLFEKARVNPAFFLQGLRPEAKTFLNRDNESPLT
jgi:hypothetical protein